MGDRPVVGHQTLDLGTVVRAHLPQPILKLDILDRRNRIVVNSAGSQSANGGSIPPCATNREEQSKRAGIPALFDNIIKILMDFL